VQLGFITGTLLYAVLNVADVFNARRVFFVSSCLGAASNLAFGFVAEGIGAASGYRFLTGVFLAGVYPVGMKLVASWFRSGLGWRLGVLVAALTLGTAFPYLLRAVGTTLDWRGLVATASALSAVGGILVLAAIGDGPHLRQRARFDPGVLTRVFRHTPFRKTAFGYFGHMWELYAFWSMVPFFLAGRLAPEDVPMASFLAVAVGAAGCLVGGWASRTAGERRVAIVSLTISGTICLASGLIYTLAPTVVVVFVLIWGFFVIADSPQFSALAARHCPAEYTGTALTVQNGIGFAVTIVSIQLTPLVAQQIGWRYALTFLAVGPLFGLLHLRR
jgi:MFS family permease